MCERRGMRAMLAPAVQCGVWGRAGISACVPRVWWVGLARGTLVGGARECPGVARRGRRLLRLNPARFVMSPICLFSFALIVAPACGHGGLPGVKTGLFGEVMSHADFQVNLHPPKGDKNKKGLQLVHGAGPAP